MFKITVDSANRRSWSNEWLDLLEGTALFLNEYLSRPEAESFRVALKRLKTEFPEPGLVLPLWEDHLRQILIDGKFGVDRHSTDQAIQKFLKVSVPKIYALSILIGIRNKGEIAAVLGDPDVGAWLAKVKWNSDHFAGRSRTRPSNQISRAIRQFLFVFRTSVAFMSVSRWLYILPSESVLNRAHYFQGMINICWTHGLKSPVAPLFLLSQRLASQHSNSPQEPTPDGLLGPLFPGQITSSLKSAGSSLEPAPTAFKEWDIISMPPARMRREVGNRSYSAVRRGLHEMGYEHGHSVNPLDFQMLFDRVYLRRSVEDVGETYSVSRETAQRRTNKLMKTLQLDSSRATPKRRLKR